MKSIRDIDVSGKRVLVRVDYNVPMNDRQEITDDHRIKATLPLIHYLMENQAKIVLISHMGRPDGKQIPKLSLAPAAERLSQLIEKQVGFADNCIGPTVQDSIASLKRGEVLVLENLRFHKQEKANDPEFAKSLASLCDVYVNDAFAVSHRSQASVEAICRFVPAKAAGFLLEKEMGAFDAMFKNPKRPLAAIIGGAKVSSKLKALENLLNHVNILVIGGAMANTFLKSQGLDTGGSLIEEDLVDTAAGIVKKAKEKAIDLWLPQDLVVAPSLEESSSARVVRSGEVPESWMALDIGPETGAAFARAIKGAKTVVWNGPMGVFETEAFRSGTQAVADAVAISDSFSFVGGGDTGLAVKLCNAADKVSYISTGGGAFLHLMEGRALPGVVALETS